MKRNGLESTRKGLSTHKGLSTLEWIVIAIVALVMIAYVLGYWKGIWGVVTGQADTAKTAFGDAISNAFK